MAATQQDWNEFADSIDSPVDAERDRIATMIRLMASPEWRMPTADEMEFQERYGAIIASGQMSREGFEREAFGEWPEADERADHPLNHHTGII